MMQPHLRAVVALVWAPVAVLLALVLAVVLALVGLPFWIGLIVGPLLAAVAVWLVLRNSVARLVTTSRNGLSTIRS